MIDVYPRKTAQNVELYFATLPISTNAIWRSVNGRNIKSGEYRSWIVAAGKELEAQHPACVPGAIAITISLAASCRLDVDNAIKALVDLLRLHNVIEGDSKKYLREIRAKHSDHETTHVRVTSTSGDSADVN